MRRRRESGPAPGTIVETTIERLGGRGDGVALLYEGPLYVPYALPGERVRARIGAPRGEGWVGRAEAILAPAPARVAPACRHFTVCGGCALQHLTPPEYRRFKREQIVSALTHRGFADATVAEPLVSPPASRRRASVAVRRTAEGCVIGFHEPAGTRIVPIAECPVTAPAIIDLLPALAACLERCLPASGSATVAIALLGRDLDVVIDAAGAPDLAAREALAGFAAERDLARLSWRTASDAAPEPIAQRRPVRAEFGGVPVALPPGAFLQATADGERAIVDAVRAALPADGRVVDLYAGCGTIGLALAEQGRAVHAVELDQAALGALAAAARAARLAVTTERRDLARQPLGPDALGGFAAALFDPPRAGAPAQAAALAGSAVPTVVAVSCHPGTFARDARILVDGGYQLEAVQPIDQFLWSAHVELVAVFRRAAPPDPRRRGRARSPGRA
jgi:23S rRNA (uracil1939-C5)-methyltransferase